jgi:stage II sporulation protein AB (anti-sigma F factor)
MNFMLELPAERSSVSRARHAIAEFARAHGVDLDRLKLAVSEAVGNAVLHAYQGRISGTVVLKAELQDRDLVVRVSDRGAGMTPASPRSGLRLGFPLIASMADRMEVDTSGPGLRVTMYFATT